ncbi:MAG TPA: hypothetical protein PKK10_04210 [Woeseiaceae bacterium]|nr:hypothetical protein [Woeseiaceae bacterium]
MSMDTEKPTGDSKTQLLPRFIRLRDAPFYLGMDRNRFNTEVRPYLTTIPIGRQGVAFDRLEMDAWVEEYISRNGRRLKASKLEDDVCQRSKAGCPDSVKGTGSGTFKSAANTRPEAGSMKARAHLLGLRQSES